MRPRSRAWALLLTAAAAAAGCAPTVADGIAAGTDLMFRQQHVEAERLFRGLLREVDARAPADPRAAQQRVTILARLGALNALYLRHARQAVADYEALVAQAPTTEEGLTALRAIAELGERRLGEPALATSAYRRIVANFAGRPEARRAQLALVDAALTGGTLATVEREVAALQAAWPASAEAGAARLALAEATLAAQRPADAAQALERLLAERPAADLAAEALFALGDATQALGDGEAALGYYYAALPAHPRPALVERKIARLRARLAHLAPGRGLLSATGPRPAARRGRRPRVAAATLPPVMGPPAAEESPEVPLTATADSDLTSTPRADARSMTLDLTERKQQGPDEAS